MKTKRTGFDGFGRLTASKRITGTLKKTIVPILIFVWAFSIWPQVAWATTDTFTLTLNTTNNYGLWTVPAGVTSADVACWGAGGGGGDGDATGGGGGGGGAFASSTIGSLIEGTSYTIFIGAKGTGATVSSSATGGTGGNSSFATTTVVGAGGTGGAGGTSGNPAGGAGGTVAASTGMVENAGGTGGNGATNGDKGGGGGGSAGPHGVGGGGVADAGGQGDNGNGGLAGAPGADNANGGGGGTGGGNGAAGAAGGNPGGGGGGGEGGGADGGGGQCTVTYAALSVPTLSTDAATEVSSFSATLNGQITDTGGANPTVRGFAWGTHPTLSNGDTATTSQTGSFGISSFTNQVSGLIAGRTYYFRAYATNSGGTGFDASSPILSFAASAADTSTTRKMRLFGGFNIKLIGNTLKLLQQ